MWHQLIALALMVGTLQQPPAEHPPSPQDLPTFHETVVVTASRSQEQLINAPAALTVIGADAIARAPSATYADLLRSAPGVNFIQTSSRDVNLTSRGATRTTANTQLVLVDGRSVYQDFLGFVLWDALPIQPEGVRQIEVMRGPSSAIWGANAVDGVINIITRPPREATGTSVTIGGGWFARSDDDAERGNGGIVSARASHAAVVSDRWAYRLTTGIQSQEAFSRPAGTIDNAFQTPYPPFANRGSSAPSIDLRVDYDAPGQTRGIVFGGGVSGVSGILHTGSGPFQIRNPSIVGYGRMNYTSGRLHVNAALNFLDGDSRSLLSLDPAGQPISFAFKSQTLDVDASHRRVVGTRQLLTYGAGGRFSNFDLTVAPDGTGRADVGAFVQDQVVVNRHLHVIAGARLDKFGVVDHPVFSPRAALVLKPDERQSVRVTANRAFRSPTLINNYLSLQLMTALDLGIINPGLAGIQYTFPVQAVGNLDLVEESVTSYEVGYSAMLARRTTLGAAYYVNHKKNTIVFSQVGSYTSADPPPGWPLPPVVLDLMQAAGAGLPSRLQDVNAGRIREQGLELSIDTDLRPELSVFANYSWQGEPDATGTTAAAINYPPTSRFNLGLAYQRPRYLLSATASHAGEARWQDVLDARYHGPTPAYTRIDASASLRFAGGKRVLSVRALNLANRAIQYHVFGDVIRRQVLVELKLAS
jgi:outer membrane receptor protein involved in Fe transport